MRPNPTYKKYFLSFVFTLLGFTVSNAQFLLRAPSDGDETNYRWYEAQDTNTVLATDDFLEITQQGVYFATYDGTLCGKNATSYFIVTNCNSPHNEVTLNISDNNIPPGATLTWSPPVSGDQTMPTVIATQTVQRYVASILKAGNTKYLPSFTVVCINEAAILVDDLVTVDEDQSVIINLFDNDSELPVTGSLTTTNPSNGSVTVDTNGTPNNPLDDIVTYTPNPDYNGSDTFEYTLCNTFGDCSTATVNITVSPIVDAIDDAITTNKDVSLDIDVLSNDNDLPNTGTLTVTNPSNGIVVINDNGTTDPSDDTINYTATTAYVGVDSFTYTICDTIGNCSSATVTIVVSNAQDLDADDDGIIDSFEDLNLDGDNDPATNSTDSDGDGIADYLDIDSDDDGIPDNVEGQTTEDYVPPSGVDANSNGLDDAYEGAGQLGIFPLDTDEDLLPDYLDEDSDNDKIPDYIEGHDANHDGIADVTRVGSDKDNDGLDDGFEGDTQIDVDVNDEINDPYNDLPNTDGDHESDYRDIDDDDDGIESKNEDNDGDGNYANDDEDNNGTPDYLEPNGDKPEVMVFNVVTPNDDGVHDFLKIDGLENYPENSIRIFNRWGVLVYTTNAYDTKGNTFKGISEGRITVKVDNKLPVGTYFYILEYEDDAGKTESKSGYIYLNR